MRLVLLLHSTMCLKKVPTYIAIIAVNLSLGLDLELCGLVNNFTRPVHFYRL